MVVIDLATGNHARARFSIADPRNVPYEGLSVTVCCV